MGQEVPSAKLERAPEVIDDFIRNYLSNKNMKNTLDSFQVIQKKSA
jgi:hypothetical protein